MGVVIQKLIGWDTQTAWWLHKPTFILFYFFQNKKNWLETRGENPLIYAFYEVQHENTLVNF
jgi:hypothetical protein